MSDLRILFCDNHLLAVVKPACVPTVPDESGDESLLGRAKEWVRVEFQKPGEAYLGVVHRLDRPVSGVVLFARTSKAAARLTEQFRARSTEKRYAAIACGRPEPEQGLLEQWLEKSESRRRVEVRRPEARGAKRALTRWRTRHSWEREGASWSLLELEPQTGRSHQLRVAMSTLGAPLRGDLKYGAPDALPDKSIALHARELVVEHPTRRERMSFECDPPQRDWWEVPDP